MKYIRTNKGVFELNKLVHIRIEGEVYEYQHIIDKHCWLVFYPEDIIKQADTIEELCDGYIVDSDENQIMAYKNINFAKQEYKLREYYKHNNLVFYGYIKTNKGLIYVAKMNDEGELELDEGELELL